MWALFFHWLMKDVVCFDLFHVEIMWGRMWKAKMHKRFRKVFEDASIRKQCTLHIWKATCNLFTIDKIENMNKTIRNGFSTTAHYRCLIQNLLDLKNNLNYESHFLHFDSNNGTNWVEYDLSIFRGQMWWWGPRGNLPILRSLNQNYNWSLTRRT